MRIIHSLIVTPGQCGLYETARDLIVAEERLGHDVVVLEPAGASKGMKDTSIAVATNKQRAGFLANADVLIDHSGCDGEILSSGVPIVHVRHGRPLATFLSSINGGLDVYSHMAKIGHDERYRAFVTFWEDHAKYWEAIIGRRVHYVPAPVDLERFTPEGAKHDFGDKGGTINVVCSDMWGRADECPFEVVQQFREFAENNKDARLHVYGLKENNPAINTLLRTLGDNLGQVGWAKNMPSIYRAADFTMSASTTATRAQRESLACGCPLFNFGTSRSHARAIAEQQYDANESAKSMITICEQVAGAMA